MHFSWGFQRESNSFCFAAAVLSGCEGEEGAGLKDEGESPSSLPSTSRGRGSKVLSLRGLQKTA